MNLNYIDEKNLENGPANRNIFCINLLRGYLVTFHKKHKENLQMYIIRSIPVTSGINFFLFYFMVRYKAGATLMRISEMVFFFSLNVREIPAPRGRTEKWLRAP